MSYRQPSCITDKLDRELTKGDGLLPIKSFGQVTPCGKLKTLYLLSHIMTTISSRIKISGEGLPTTKSY